VLAAFKRRDLRHHDRPIRDKVLDLLPDFERSYAHNVAVLPAIIFNEDLYAARVCSAGKHLRNATRHHRAAVAAAESDDRRAWGAVALFYAGHQLVHAVLDGEQRLAPELRHPEKHGARDGT
jgi:hypothetical protein